MCIRDRIPPGHAEVVGALLHPVGGAGVHIAEIAETFGLQILEPGVVLGVGVEIRDVVAEGVEDDVRGPDEGFHLGFPAVRVVPEALILDGKAVEGLFRVGADAQLQVTEAVGGQLPAVIPECLGCLLYTSRCV